MPSIEMCGRYKVFVLPKNAFSTQAVRKKMDKKSNIEKAKRVRDANNRAALYTCLVFIETEQINPFKRQ